MWRFWQRKTRLSDTQWQLLQALDAGYTLKGHRYLSGGKEFKLYQSTTFVRQVDSGDVDRLLEAKLLDSNMKFPAATFFISEKGRSLVKQKR